MKKRYSIITDDLTHCIECGRTDVELHEVWYGANRKLSIEDGLVIPLCKRFSSQWKFNRYSLRLRSKFKVQKNSRRKMDRTLWKK